MVRLFGCVILAAGFWLLREYRASEPALLLLMVAAGLLLREGRQLLDTYRNQPGGSRRRTPHFGHPGF